MKPFVKIDYTFVFLLIFCLLINIPYLNPEFMVGHDTKSCFIAFHYFFNHLSWHEELPRWMVYSGYGYSSIWYQLINFSPNTYLLGFIGWLFEVRDTMMLFKLCALADQLVFLLGLHLLTKRLYACRYTRAVVCIAGIGSVVWYWQIYFDLRLFYLIPLVIYFYHRFLVDRQPWAFWAAILVMLMNMLGAVPYWAPVYLLLFLVVNAVLLPKYRCSLSSLSRPGWAGISLMLLCVAGAVSLSYVYATGMNGMQNYTLGRSSEDMATDLKTFLTYSPPLWGLLHSFLDGIRPYSEFNAMRPDDMRLYVGLFTVAALPIAIFKVRDRWFYALLAVLVSIVLLAGSGITSWLLYLVFPGMDKVRHLCLMLDLAKIIMLLAAGYGMEVIFGKLADLRWLKEHFRLPPVLLILASLVFILDMIVADNVNDDIWVSSMEVDSLLPVGGAWIVMRLCVWALFAIAVFLLSRSNRLNHSRYSKQLLPNVILLVCIFDMCSFQMNRWDVRAKASHVFKPAFEKLNFIDTRRLGNNLAFKSRNESTFTHKGDAFESFFTNVLQDSACLPMGRVDLASDGVHNLLTARGLPMDLVQQTFVRLSLPDVSLRKVLGCDSSKLRVVPQAHFLNTDDELVYYIKNKPALDYAVVLRGTPPPGMPEPIGTVPVPADYVVKDFNANRLDIEVDVKPGQSGWLVYADSYDQHWKAFVNNVEVPLYEAYMAFKAVFVNEGRNRVLFVRSNDKLIYAMNCLVVMGIAFSAICMFGLFRNIWNRE